jgi:hypothetical protein
MSGAGQAYLRHFHFYVEMTVEHYRMKTSATVSVDIHELYKPFRNKIRKLNLKSLLNLIWASSSTLLGEAVVRLKDTSGGTTEIYLWELHILAREAVLHAPPNEGRNKLNAKDLLALVSHIRRIIEGTSERTIFSTDAAVQSLHPLINQQARWQRPRDWDRLYRAFNIYSRDNIRPLLEEVVRVRLSTIITLAFAVTATAQRTPVVDASVSYSFMGIEDAERDAFFAMIGAPLLSVRSAISNRQRYNRSWAYTWNPLEGSPLIQLQSDQPHLYVCTEPQLVLRRATEGLFFDLSKSKGFANPYGNAFQAYVGDVLRSQFTGPFLRVVEEREYWVNNNRKDGIDWAVSDPSGHLMIECKARRPKVDSKSVMQGGELTESIDSLAKMVVQHYKNVRDALAGLSPWKPDGKPVYPIIVTYEDWYLFTPHVIEDLDNVVRKKLAEHKLESMLDTAPFIVTPIAEFEQAGQAVAQIGIDRFFASRTSFGNRHFGLGMHAPHAFPDIPVKYKRLFEHSAQEMLATLAHLMELPGQSE